MRQLKIDLSKCNGGRDCNHECENACASKVFRLNDSTLAAITIQALDDNTSLALICDQCGDCAQICPAEALKRNNNGVVVMNKKKCVGCYMCVGFCDKVAFKRHADWLEPYKCNACGICVQVCPKNALQIIDAPIPAPRII